MFLTLQCGRSSCEADCEFLLPETDGPDQAEERDGVVENSGIKIMNSQIKLIQMHTAGYRFRPNHSLGSGQETVNT